MYGLVMPDTGHHPEPSTFSKSEAKNPNLLQLSPFTDSMEVREFPVCELYELDLPCLGPGPCVVQRDRFGPRQQANRLVDGVRSLSEELRRQSRPVAREAFRATQAARILEQKSLPIFSREECEKSTKLQ